MENDNQPLPPAEPAFNLPEYIHTWYEKVIPTEIIPEQYRRELPLPGGGKQIIDTRIKGWTYHPDQHAYLVCPEAMFDEEDIREWGGDWL